jgi:flagellar hook assembly protein FlgD
VRRSVVAIVFALVAALGVFTPAASAATAPKVVIIVGATHGATASYRLRADKAYAEAIKYTPNVVKVYSPNATWSKVKAAVKGASIVVYFGHGNGWPSPYTYDSKYTTKDGFGLNATAGNGDSNNKYYGEPYVSTMALAPNAVVILSNLCYASGNSEPGDPAPSVTTARKRVDNYGAGFLKAARAVIADGHGSPEPYIRGLFTTHATIEEVWRSAPNFHDHVVSFPSTRTPGAVAFTDTDTASAGYYRSLVWKPGLTTDQVTGASYADTGVDPATLVVPGNAEVGAAGASLYGSDGQPAGTLAAGVRVRVVESVTALASPGSPSVRVEGIDDPSLVGWVVATDLLPRDSKAPAIWAVDAAGGVFSPNGDERYDVASLSGRFSEPVDWRVRVLDSETVLDERTGHGSTFATTWDGLAGGGALPDGTYEYQIRAQDAWGNGPTTKTGSLTIDTTGPVLATVSPDADAARWFSPNGDGSRDSITWTATAVERGTLVTRVYDASDQKVSTSTQSNGTGASAITWAGLDDDGHVVPDGVYTVRVTPRDAAGTNGPTVERTVRVDTMLGSVKSSTSVFYPQDGDRLGRATNLSFGLTRGASVTMSIIDANGHAVTTLLQDEPTAAGVATHRFEGLRDDGTRLPFGRYAARVTATDGTRTVDQSIGFEINAFAMKVSDTTPKRGQTITVYATSAESLGARPRLYVKQPGKATWSVRMTKTSTNRYKVTIKLKTGGGTGTVRFKVVGTDIGGQRQWTRQVYAIH